MNRLEPGKKVCDPGFHIGEIQKDARGHCDHKEEKKSSDDSDTHDNSLSVVLLADLPAFIALVYKGRIKMSPAITSYPRYRDSGSISDLLL